jgi:NADPH-dependent 2,4-dienoyl-CoA reductase/sulfur reductase-like enzyme/rhodanese-related sulfurtransferase/TusA-related sulfurtransferase
MKVIIVGGSAGGASVAARLRRLDEFVEIIMLERSEEISFATCGMPYYLGGIIKDRDRLTIIDQEEFKSILNVDVRTANEVVAIDRANKTVTIRDIKQNREYQESYDKLVLSPGGAPIIPDIPGVDHAKVFTLRNGEDMDAILHYLEERQCKHATVVGAGFIGLELAENLHHRGLHVNIVDNADQVMGSWDMEMATMIHFHLHSKNVNLVLNDHVKEIDEHEVILGQGEKLSSDIVILALGVYPDVTIAREAKLSIGKKGGIAVNDGLITSDENIFALGDAVEVQDRITHNKSLIPLAGIAHKQARVVAENICGMHRIMKDVQVTAIAKVFDLTVAITGGSERSLIENNINYSKSYIEAPSHAGYYPDAFPMVIKLLFASKTGRILGAQIIGVDGVDKRIDVIATSINYGKTVYDLIDLELSYAPPFSSAKDPVNIAGMVAKNMLRENYKVIHWDDIDSQDKDKTVIIDVRTTEEFNIRAIKDAINIPLTELRDRLSEIPKDKTIVTYCQQGKKSYFAYKILVNHGYKKVFNLSGGFKIYSMIKNRNETGFSGIFDYDRVSSDDVFYSDTDTDADIPVAVPDEATNIIEIDACGMSCPGPILKLSKSIKRSEVGSTVRVIATDTGFAGDVESWCKKTGNNLISIDNKDAKYIVTVMKG